MDANKADYSSSCVQVPQRKLGTVSTEFASMPNWLPNWLSNCRTVS